MAQDLGIKIIARGADLQKVEKSVINVSLPDSAKELLENKEGIEETKDVLVALCEVGKFYKSALADDGKITIGDAFKLVGVVKAVPAAVVGFNKIGDELADEISADEVAELQKVVLDAGIIEGDSENAVIDGIELAAAVKKYIQKYFIKKS